ncbi:MAG: addiction module toxin RelE [Proteobacteria bacterium ST_bin14]|nr:MAG: addiction module toxin RelE [Proteobacteria bacterium ST_bin14]
MEIVYSKAARQALLRSNKRKLLLEKIEQLANQPESLANNITQLQGREEWRLRVQDWRVIFLRQGDSLLIRDIAPRASIYED